MKLVSRRLEHTARSEIYEILQEEAEQRAFLNILNQGALNPKIILSELPPSNALDHRDRLILRLLPTSNSDFRKFATTCSYSELDKLALFDLRLVPQDEAISFSEEVIAFVRRYPTRNSIHNYYPEVKKLRNAGEAYSGTSQIPSYYPHYFVWEVLRQHYTLEKPFIETEALMAALFGKGLQKHWISMRGLDFLLEKSLRLYGSEETFLFLEARLQDTVTLPVYQWSKYLDHLATFKDLPLEWVAGIYEASEKVK